MDKNVVTYMGFESDYQQSCIVLFGVPFDGTTSFRPGTRFASSVMRQESYGLETWSPYLQRDLDDYDFFDGGDLDLPFGNPIRVIDMIHDYSKEVLLDGKKPLMIGGEHLVTLGAIKACHAKYPDMAVIHFDAHADLRDEYMGESMSHASVIRKCHEILEPNNIYQFGIRSGTKEEFEFAKANTYMELFEVNTVKSIVDQIGKQPVYITIDLDVLDPSVFPGTGTPEPGGISFKEIIEAIKSLDTLNIIGADIVELSPNYDQTGISTAAACKVVRELSLVMVEDK